MAKRKITVYTCDHCLTDIDPQIFITEKGKHFCTEICADEYRKRTHQIVE